MDTNDELLSRWNFPRVQWKYSPKLSSGEPLDVLVADWTSLGTVATTEITMELMKLVFAWIDVRTVKTHSKDVPLDRFKGFEVIAALAACNMAKREYVLMETAKMMYPDHEHLLEHVSETEQAIWETIARMNPQVADVSRASEEIKTACLAAIVVESMLHTCDIQAFSEIYTAETPEKWEEKEKEILLNSVYWQMSSPAERIIILSFMGLTLHLLDRPEVWEDARELGYFTSYDGEFKILEGWISLSLVWLRVTRRQARKEMAEIVTR